MSLTREEKRMYARLSLKKRKMPRMKGGDALEIARRYEGGESEKSICDDTGWSPLTVQRIVTMVEGGDVPPSYLSVAAKDALNAKYKRPVQLMIAKDATAPTPLGKRLDEMDSKINRTLALVERMAKAWDVGGPTEKGELK